MFKAGSNFGVSGSSCMLLVSSQSTSQGLALVLLGRRGALRGRAFSAEQFNGKEVKEVQQKAPEGNVRCTRA